MGVQPVAHQLEFAIRGNEADGAVILEPRKTDTLVELDVLHLDGLSSRCATCGLEHDLVVQTQTKFRHTTQITLHLDSTENLRSQHVTRRGHEEVKGLHNIKEDFVLAVPDTLTSP